MIENQPLNTLAITGSPTVAMSDNLAKKPDKGIMFELSMNLQNGRLVFGYKNSGKFTFPVTVNGSDHNTIDSLMIEIAKNGWLPSNWMARPPIPRRSNLSLNNKSRTYVIVKLDPELNWQFSREVSPFSLFYSVPREYYANPTSIDPSGDEIALPQIDPSLKSMFAYFEADGGNAYVRQGYRNSDRFNIHVDINEDETADPPRFIPIVIDPDIGHPGGNDGG